MRPVIKARQPHNRGKGGEKEQQIMLCWHLLKQNISRIVSARLGIDIYNKKIYCKFICFVFDLIKPKQYIQD